MRNSLTALTLLAAPAVALGVTAPAVAESVQLANTGADIAVWIVAAIVFLGLGALLFFISHRQRVKGRSKDEAAAAALSAAEGAAAARATTTDDEFIDAGEVDPNPAEPGDNQPA